VESSSQLPESGLSCLHFSSLEGNIDFCISVFYIGLIAIQFVLACLFSVLCDTWSFWLLSSP
jgi:hypothetical protein